MKELILVILMFVTIGFCITKICEAIMYNKFLKKQSIDFDKFLDEMIEKAEIEIIKEDNKEEKKVTKKATTKKTKKKESEENK